jgi:chemosensory pili system protein ChpA (sensor histidine kinase/response regulator)
LLAVDAKGLDAGFWKYLIRAFEVLDTVATTAAAERNPRDRGLRSARRQFHTLKGSGRMVGLNELGELAWDVERVHNRLLEEERAGTPVALAMMETAETSFRRWMGALKDTGSVAAAGRVARRAPPRGDELPPDRRRAGAGAGHCGQRARNRLPAGRNAGVAGNVRRRCVGADRSVEPAAGPAAAALPPWPGSRE